MVDVRGRGLITIGFLTSIHDHIQCYNMIRLEDLQEAFHYFAIQVKSNQEYQLQIMYFNYRADGTCNSHGND